MGVDARGFPGGLLRLDPAFAYVEPPSSWPLPWAEYITLATGSDRIPVELFQILKDDAVESAALNMQYAICTQYAICRLPALLHFAPSAGVVEMTFYLPSILILLLIKIPHSFFGTIPSPQSQIMWFSCKAYMWLGTGQGQHWVPLATVIRSLMGWEHQPGQ